MPQWLIKLIELLLGSVIGVSKAVEVRTKPEEIQIKQHEDNRPKQFAIRNKGLYNDEYRRLKDHWSINIEEDVRLINGNLSKEDQDLLISLLKQRIDEYRRKYRPIRYRRWLAKNPNSPNLPK